MRSFIITSALALFVHAQEQQLPVIPLSFCGNGRIDPGEQCDPSDPSISADCCDSNCRLSPPSTVCSNGLGVCMPSGNCTTRAAVCSSFNNNSLRIPQSGGSVAGPFGVCYSAGTNSDSRSVQTLIDSKSVSGGSVLTKLLPSAYLSQSQCLMSCSGSSTNQSDPTCIDFAKYQNLPALVPDYLGCVVDRTTGVDFEALVSANPSDNEIETRIVQPGVCITGVCRSDICRSVRCNNRGNCGLSSGALKSIKKGLGIGGSDGFDSAQQEAALIRCNCDRGFFGTMCQFVGNSSAINNTSSGEQNSEFGKKQAGVLAGAVIGTFALTVLAAFMILYVTRRPGNKGNNLLSEDLGVNSVEGEERDLEKAVQDAVLNAYPQIKETTDISEKSDDSFNTFFGSVPLAANTEQPSRIIQDQQFIADEEQAPTKFDEVTPSAEQDIADLNQEPKHERSQSAAKSQDIMGTEDSRNANESSQQKTNTMTDQNNYMRAAHIYHPRMADEIELAPGDILYLIRSYDDGWAKAYNVRTGKEGIFPLSFAKKAKSSSKVST